MFTASSTPAYTAVQTTKFHVNSAASRESTTDIAAQINAATRGAREPSVKYSAKWEHNETVSRRAYAAPRKTTTIRLIVAMCCPFVVGESRES